MDNYAYIYTNPKTKKMITKDTVIQTWNECQLKLKNKFTEYHSSIKEYQLKFGKKRKAYGTCKYRTKTIEIHMYLCKHVKLEDLIDTILHEMAHAIDMEVNGYCSKHGSNWKKIAEKIGSDPTSSSSKGNDIIKKSKYVLAILNNDGSFEYICSKHRKSRSIQLNTPLNGAWVVGRKKATISKLIYITWSRFTEEYKSGNMNIKTMEVDKTINL